MSQVKFPFVFLMLAIFVKYTTCNLGFGFSNCGPNTDPFIVNQLSAQPDPIKIPGQLSIDAGVTIKSNITGPMEVFGTFSKPPF